MFTHGGLTMPLYSFDCSKCGARVQKALVTSQRWMDCPKCGEMMKRQGYTREPSVYDGQKTMEAYNMEKVRERQWREGKG